MHIKKLQTKIRVISLILEFQTLLQSLQKIKKQQKYDLSSIIKSRNKRKWIINVKKHVDSTNSIHKSNIMHILTCLLLIRKKEQKEILAYRFGKENL